MENLKKISLPDNLNGRSIEVKVIPTVCNLENMLKKLVEVNGDFSKLEQWEKRSYKAYQIEDIKIYILQANPFKWKNIVREHILKIRPLDLGASVVDIYLVAYVAEMFGVGKEIFFKYVKNKGISSKKNSAQAIWQVGKGDGVYLQILNENGSIKDWNFVMEWLSFKGDSNMNSNIFNKKCFDEWKQSEFLRRKPELVNFYRDYFENEESAEKFIIKIYDRVSIEDNRVIRMMNNIKRFSTMIDDNQNKIEINLFFLIIGIESLYKLSNNKNNQELINKKEILKNFLNNYLIDVEKNYLTNKIVYSISDDKYSMGNKYLSLADISDLFTEIRNRLAHEGVYGYFSFGSDESPQINIINLFEGDEIKEARKEIKKNKSEKITIDEYKETEKYRRTYEISITYDEFKDIIVKCMIRFLQKELQNEI